MVGFKSLVGVPNQVDCPGTWWRSDSVSEFSKLFECDFGVLRLTVQELDEGDFVFVVEKKLFSVGGFSA
jgi:hypothetical protein